MPELAKICTVRLDMIIYSPSVTLKMHSKHSWTVEPSELVICKLNSCIHLSMWVLQELYKSIFGC